MNIEIDGKNISYDLKKFQKMVLIYNALEDGWKVTKKNNNYFFKKNTIITKNIFLMIY